MKQHFLRVLLVIASALSCVTQSGAVEPATKPSAQPPTTQRVLFERQASRPTAYDVRVVMEAVPPNRERLVIYMRPALPSAPAGVGLFTRFAMGSDDLLMVDDVREVACVTFVWCSSMRGVFLYVLVPKEGEYHVLGPIVLWRSEGAKQPDYIAGVSPLVTATRDFSGGREFSVQVVDVQRVSTLVTGKVIVEWDSQARPTAARFERDAEGK